MKLTKSLLLFSAILSISSCGTINIKNHNYNDSKNMDPSKVATLIYDRNIDVKEVNGDRVHWDMTIGNKIIKLPMGEYSFLVKYGAATYSNGRQGWASSDEVLMDPIFMDGGHVYALETSTVGSYIKFSITESDFLIPE